METLIQIVAEPVLDINNIFNCKAPFRNLEGVFYSKTQKKTEKQRISGKYHFQYLKFSAKYDIINNDK